VLSCCVLLGVFSIIACLQEKSETATASIADEGTALEAIIGKYKVSATDREGKFIACCRCPVERRLHHSPFVAALLNWRHSHDF